MPKKTVYKYTRSDIAKAKGVSKYAIYHAIERGILDPDSLMSIAKYLLIDRRESVNKIKPD